MMMGKHHSKAKRNLITKLANETHFTEEEVRHWYKGFFSDCPAGQLTEKRFIGIYQRFFPEGDSTKFAKSVFRVFDENKDGLIEFEEFVKGLSIVTRGNLDEKLKWSFKLYDENSDGYLTKNEIFKTLDYIELLMQPIESRRTQNHESINQIDENMPINELNNENSNKMNDNIIDIDKNEIIKNFNNEDNLDKINNDLTEESNSSSMERNRTLDIKLCKDKIEKIFQKIDKNSITMEQFLQLSKDDPELCKLLINLQP